MNRDDEVAEDLATNYQPRRAEAPKPAGVEVPAWFLIGLIVLALMPTLLVVIYYLLIEG